MATTAYIVATLLAIASTSSAEINDTNLVAISRDSEECLFLYTTNITVRVYNLTIKTPPEVLATYYNFTFESDRVVDFNSSQCWSISNDTESHTKKQEEPAVLDLSFTDGNETRLDLHFVIDSPYSRNMSDFWHINSTTANLTFKSDSQYYQKGGQFDLMVNQTGAEQNFGYSCGSLTILSEPRNLSVEETNDGLIPQISINFARFQLQPFKNPQNQGAGQNKYVFTESYDCQVWFTLPLWMGLITLTTLFVILFTGIYFVSQINTPDRFENPKGKPLIISNVDE